MAVDDYDQEDERAARATRRDVPHTDRLARDDEAYTGPLRQDWRSSRTMRRPRRNTTLPSSRQEFVIWLQRGGWRIVAIAAAVVFVIILALILNRQARELPNNSTAGNALPTAGLSTGAEPTVGGAAAETSAPTSAPPAAQGAQFRVTGTETEGLFLRADADQNSTVLMTLPEGTVVTVIGEDKSGPNYTWKHVRAPDGTEGWAASDYLQPVQ
jgi:hypothetical protein